MICFKCCCGKIIEVSDDMLGKMVRCPECGRDRKVEYNSEKIFANNLAETVLPGNFIIKLGDWFTGPGLFIALVLLVITFFVILMADTSGSGRGAGYISGVSLPILLLFALDLVILVIIIKYFISLLKCQHIIIDLLTKQNSKLDDAK